MDAGTHDATALAHRFERKRHELTGRSVDDRRVEQLRRQLVGSAGPARTEAACKGLGGNIPRPSKSEPRPPQLKDMLCRPQLLQFAQRVSSDFHLKPLAQDEV